MLDDTARVRFASKCFPAQTGCLEWKGPTNGSGYGKFNLKGRFLLAHRVAYADKHAIGYPEPTTIIRHKCDNPSCVNPAHLIPGTQIDNMRDMKERRRGRYDNATHCKRGHEYTSRLDENGRRRCWTCANERQLDYIARTQANPGVADARRKANRESKQRVAAARRALALAGEKEA